jgi:hypothetical protein
VEWFNESIEIDLPHSFYLMPMHQVTSVVPTTTLAITLIKKSELLSVVNSQGFFQACTITDYSLTSSSHPNRFLGCLLVNISASSRSSATRNLHLIY